jgi:hypothetical protein
MHTKSHSLSENIVTVVTAHVRNLKGTNEGSGGRKMDLTEIGRKYTY